ncbi:MAG: GAF domain-containing protein [Candidatus Omnitrophica bacterium]|nr:GAF domain-containing protein [Candidatus Omnitrophota bacterium]
MTEGKVPREETIVETLGQEDLQRLLGDHQKLLILYGFANAVSRLLDKEKLLNEAMNVVFGLVKAERGAIFLVDGKTGKLMPHVWRARQAGTKGNEVILSNAVTELVMRERKSVLSLDAMMDERFKGSQSIQIQSIRSCMCVPLESQHRTLGLLYVDSRLQAGSFSKEELTLVSGIANQTAVALENIDLVHRLSEERKRIEGILNALTLAIISIDEEGAISFVNPQAMKLFEVTGTECLGHPYQTFFEGGLFRALLGLMTPALQEGKGVTLGEVACGDVEKSILLQVNIIPLREGLVRKGILVALDDVTEKRTLEREMANAEKLSAIGEMTAGLIHEINNPLNIISGRAQLLLFEKGEDAEVSKAARVIREQVDRASSITEKLLSFARQRPPHLRPISLHELLDQFLETLEDQFTLQQVRLEKKFEASSPSILGDAEQLEEVFVNLALNAVQAMPKGGRFTVATRQEKETVEISFTDTGCGIPPDHLSKIFIPFFTTKSRGTGLGLSIVHGIVDNHGGTLKIHSQVGKGSTFILTMPLAKGGET